MVTRRRRSFHKQELQLESNIAEVEEKLLEAAGTRQVCQEGPALSCGRSAE